MRFNTFKPTNTYIKTHTTRRTLVYGISTFFLLAGFLFVNPPFHDDSSSATTVQESVASDTWLSLSIEDSSLALELVPSSTNGTFMSTADTEDHANISVVTNNITGYTLGIKASGSNGGNNSNNTTSDIYRDLISTDERCVDTPTSSKCAINSLSTAVSKEDYSDSSTSGAELNNTWGYMPSKYNSANNTNYLPAPTNDGDVLDTTSAPNTPQPGYSEDTTRVDSLQPNKYTIDLGSRVDYTTYAGSYTNTFIITAVGNPVPYSVTYNENAPEYYTHGTYIQEIPSAQIDTTPGGDSVAVTLSTKVPKITNMDGDTLLIDSHTFNGWCTSNTEVPDIITYNDGTTAPNTGRYQVCPEGNEVFYPKDIYGIDQTRDINTEVLYAIWGAPAKVNFVGNGLIFIDPSTGISSTENTVEYVPLHEEGIDSPKQNYDINKYMDPTQDETDPTANIIFKGWSEDPHATEATYADVDAIRNDLDLNAYDSITLYAVWSYATVIVFDGNGGDGNMQPQYIEAGTTEQLNQNTYIKEGLVLAGWNTEDDGSGISYRDQGNYTAPEGSNDITLYAQWAPADLTFNVFEGIETLIVVDSSENWRPYYLYEGGFKTFTAPVEGTKYIVTVVPYPGYKISSDSNNSSWDIEYGTGTLTSNTLLTTTYIAGTAGNVLTISGEEITEDDKYPTMQDLTLAQCPAYTESIAGINVTDSRDDKSYTVAKFDDKCYMLSNLRLDGDSYLTPADSNVTEDYTLPSDTYGEYWENDYCKPRMTNAGGEYYYNWPAVTARNNTASSTSVCDNDTDNSVGDICPAGWILPTYNDITADTLWGNGDNPGMLYTAGYFNTGHLNDVGKTGLWWSSTRYNAVSSYNLNFRITDAGRDSHYKFRGFTTRCMRSS